MCREGEDGVKEPIGLLLSLSAMPTGVNAGGFEPANFAAKASIFRGCCCEDELDDGIPAPIPAPVPVTVPGPIPALELTPKPEEVEDDAGDEPVVDRENEPKESTTGDT